MRIDRLTPADDGAYVAFLDEVGKAEGGEIILGYHYPENREMLLRVLASGTEACYLAARSRVTGEILAVLPGMIQRHGDQACYNSLPFFGPNVGVLARAVAADRYAQLASALTEAAIDIARGAGALTAVFNSSFNPRARPLCNPVLESLPGTLRICKFTQYLDLACTEAIKWPPVVRRNLAKAAASGLTVDECVGPEDISAVWHIYKSNCEQTGIPLKPRLCLDRLLDRRQVGDRVRAYVARLDGRVVAGLIVFWGPRTASYYVPCTDVAFRGFQPGVMLIDHACRDAQRHGVRYWNWESSPGRDSGVYRFKKKWGSHEMTFDVHVVQLAGRDRLQSLTREVIQARFPFFFVFPFDRLPSAAAPAPPASRGLSSD